LTEADKPVRAQSRPHLTRYALPRRNPRHRYARSRRRRFSTSSWRLPRSLR